jgi:hypothetical protein
MSRLAVFAIALTLLAAGCGGSKSAAPEQPTTSSSGSTTPGAHGSRQLTDMRNIGQLRSLFNTRSGEPRLILLVSPT